MNPSIDDADMQDNPVAEPVLHDEDGDGDAVAGPTVQAHVQLAKWIHECYMIHDA